VNKILVCLILVELCTCALAVDKSEMRNFDDKKDLISLHYDHAPDRDDGHSTVADRTILETVYGVQWISNHVVAVSGTYGKNKKAFNSKSDKVMDVTWNDRGGWIAADKDWNVAVNKVLDRWVKTLESGGDIYVKEGGQSDITADLVKRLGTEYPDVNTKKRIHVIQHSNWNENQTTDEDLKYIKANTDYIRIKDANRYLNVKGGNKVFEEAAKNHAVFGDAWQAAFVYYPPNQRLDFSDTGELMHILGLGEMSIDKFRVRFLIKD
jgi:hypothetical protein